MFEMEQIGERLRTQDGRITQDPIFAVEQKKRIWGMDPDGDEANVVWLDSDCEVVTESFAKRHGGEAEGFTRTAFIEIWEFVSPFFTEAAAQRYIAENSHNLKSPRIYAHSAYRNREFIAIRKHLMGLPSKAETDDIPKEKSR